MRKFIALLLRRWAQRRSRGSPTDVLRAARATMRRKKYCLLATPSAQGVDARVLEPFATDDDFVVWFGTSKASRKVQQIRRNPAATLVYQDDSRAACVVLVGTITIVEDPTERTQRFKPMWWAFWPDGALADDFVLLRFEAERIEVWDAARRITPEPFGLVAAQLVRKDASWVLG